MEFNLEKIGIFLVAVTIFFLVGTRLMPFVLSSAARMMGADRNLPPQTGQGTAQPAPAPARPAPSPLAAATDGFAREAVEAVEGDWDDISQANAALAGLRARRQRAVAREGDLLRSRVAWKIAVFSQAALYRVVMLAEGSTRMWNARNVLGAVQCARGVIEAGALIADFERQARRLCEAGDLGALDALVMERTFGNTLADLVDQKPAQHSIEIAPLVDAFDRQEAGARARYDILSRLAEPAALGQVRMFGDLDKSGTVVTFSETAMFERGTLNQIAGALRTVPAIEEALASLDALLPRVVELGEG